MGTRSFAVYAAQDDTAVYAAQDANGILHRRLDHEDVDALIGHAAIERQAQSGRLAQRRPRRAVVGARVLHEVDAIARQRLGHVDELLRGELRIEVDAQPDVRRDAIDRLELDGVEFRRRILARPVGSCQHLIHNRNSLAALRILIAEAPPFSHGNPQYAEIVGTNNDVIRVRHVPCRRIGIICGSKELAVPSVDRQAARDARGLHIA